MVIAVSPLAERLKQARLSRRLTLEQVAEALNTSYPTIWRYEAGQRTPSGPVLFALANLYAKSVEWFFSAEIPEPTADPDLEADRELLMNEVDLAFRAVSNELSDEAIRSIANYIRFVHEREERRRRESQG